MHGMSHAGMSHAHHATKGMQTPVSADHDHSGMQHHASGMDGPFGDLVCKCGPGCTMASCVGTGPGLAGAPLHHVVHAALSAYESAAPASAPRAAHGLDLIRPPSKS